MPIIRIASQGITHPFGDSRTVAQAFPSGIPSEQSDPFLMCDYWASNQKSPPASHPDDFPVDWHPHRGMDIASYLRTGTGRHGDSLGNRETFSSPGMQWMSVGSGVEHAEGGANDVGTFTQGFQIWINVPSERKMDDPRYGTVPSEKLPEVTLKEGAGGARVLAGDALGVKGPFETVQPVQMVDFRLEPGSTFEFDVTEGFDTAMLYVYEGSLKVGEDDEAKQGSIVLFDASSDDARGFAVSVPEESTDDADDEGETSKGVVGAMLFAGKKIKEPIAWHGPIVMNTQDEIRQTIRELRTGRFPPKRVEWDYRSIETFPEEILRKW